MIVGRIAMHACLRVFFAATLLALGMSSAPQAQDAGAVYVVSYFETQPGAKAQAASLLQNRREAVRKETGNLRSEAVEHASRPGQYVLLTAWKDQPALEAHLAAPSTKTFREKIHELRVSPQDDRTHVALSVGPIDSQAAERAIHVVTHVDVVPPRKDDAVGILKTLGEAARKENGNLRFEVVQQTNRPNHFTVVEIWKDRAAFDAHLAGAPVREFRDKLAPMSGSLYDERLYNTLGKAASL
jgi:quinol monooxygenase YgiN